MKGGLRPEADFGFNLFQLQAGILEGLFLD
ncbi:hypothetical protein [Pseudomonas sp. 37 R 15]|nr:hypothetical protein [Pseudomonas sp. 37 R 15]